MCPIPAGQPHYLSLFKPLMASDSSSGFSHLLPHFFTDTQSTTERVEEKNKRTNTDLGQLQVQEGKVCDTFCASCEITRACTRAKTLTKPSAMLTFVDWSPLCPILISWLTFSWLLSLADLSFPWLPHHAGWSLLLPSADCLLLSSLGPSFPRPTDLVGDLAPKQTKRFSDWHSHTHPHNECTTSCYSSYSHFIFFLLILWDLSSLSFVSSFP